MMRSELCWPFPSLVQKNLGGTPAGMIRIDIENALPEANSSHLKHWGWKMSFLVTRPPGRCELLVSGRVNSVRACDETWRDLAL